MDVIAYGNVGISITYPVTCINKYAKKPKKTNHKKTIGDKNSPAINIRSDEPGQLTNTQYLIKKLIEKGYSYEQIAEASTLCKSTIRKIDCGEIKSLSHKKFYGLLIVYCRMLCRKPIKARQENKK